MVIQGNKQQQQQQCIYLQNYKIYNTLCPANRYNAKSRQDKTLNKGDIKLHKKKEKKYNKIQKETPYI